MAQNDVLTAYIIKIYDLYCSILLLLVSSWISYFSIQPFQKYLFIFDFFNSIQSIRLEQNTLYKKDRKTTFFFHQDSMLRSHLHHSPNEDHIQKSGRFPGPIYLFICNFSNAFLYFQYANIINITWMQRRNQNNSESQEFFL